MNSILASWIGCLFLGLAFGSVFVSIFNRWYQEKCLKIQAKNWWLPALIVLVLDIVTSEWIWMNGGFDLNPLYSPIKGMSPEFAIGIFTLIITHVIIFVFTLWTSSKMPKNHSGLPFLTIFLFYLYVVTSNFLVILWGVNLPWI